jgi:hypothetical protein
VLRLGPRLVLACSVFRGVRCPPRKGVRCPREKRKESGALAWAHSGRDCRPGDLEQRAQAVWEGMTRSGLTSGGSTPNWATLRSPRRAPRQQPCAVVPAPCWTGATPFRIAVGSGPSLAFTDPRFDHVLQEGAQGAVLGTKRHLCWCERSSNQRPWHACVSCRCGGQVAFRCDA